MNLLILYIFPRILRICSYINLNTIDFSFLTLNPKTSLSYSTLSLARVLSYAMPLNTLPRLSQIYDNNRLFSSVQAVLMIFVNETFRTGVRCFHLQNSFNQLVKDKSAVSKTADQTLKELFIA